MTTYSKRRGRRSLAAIAATNDAARVQLGLQTARNVPAGFSDSGRTDFAVEVNFKAFVSEVRNNELLVDMLTATAVRNRLAWTGGTATRFGLVNVAATGYAADAPAPGTTDATTTAQDRVDENLNGASQVRIGRSSSVKKP